MRNIAKSFGREYQDLLNSANTRLRGKWVQKKILGGEITGEIVQAYINTEYLPAIGVNVRWKDGTEERIHLDQLEEW